MDDRKLLEQAAEAAGYTIDFEEPVNGFYVNGYDENGDPAAWWNPLIDDGDALRLAVNFGLLLRNRDDLADAYSREYSKGTLPKDKYAAMRRVIVRAAAEIGKAL